MLFNTVEFFWFFLITLGLFYALPRSRPTLRVLALVIASYYFYACWKPVYLLLLLFSSLLDYGLGFLFLKWPAQRHKYIVLISASCNLGILAFFKYTDFFISTINLLLSQEAVLPLTGHELPVGISFYTFQTMSYAIDIKRGETKVERNFLRFLLYVSFFPQLVAGPIERARSLLPALQNLGEARPLDWPVAVHQIARGLFKKVVIADNLGPVVEQIFRSPGQFSGEMVLLGAILFSLEIYCDFSGYTDMAIGLAALLGVRLGLNFQFPYFATSITDFWRRWHISLSTWLRDYLYIPLGGNRSGRVRTYINLMLTMLLGGLWHGPSWNFVLWGFLHGFYLAIERLLPFRPGRPWSWFLWPFVFLLVTLTWIPFVTSSFSLTLQAFEQIFLWQTGEAVPQASLTPVFLCLALFSLFELCEYSGQRGLWTGLRGALTGAYVALTTFLGAGEVRQFIYFAF
ncbi:MAG: MBOAT family protein [Spirochaetales bacterium]|nr:MBOAT family protein [Spirochaetales bacterium]